MGRYHAILFDMDGTLLDTLTDMQAAVNYILEKYGYPTRTLEEVRRFVGNGNRLLAARAVPEGTPEETVERVLQNFHKHYRTLCAVHTRPYEGVTELLKRLRAAGVRTAVISNKADYAVQALAVRYFPGLFDAVAGEKEGIRRKPAPDGVLAALRTLGIDRKDAVYVGDSDVDVETARNAGLSCIAVAWGFRTEEVLRRSGAETVAHTMDELEAQLR